MQTLTYRLRKHVTIIPCATIIDYRQLGAIIVTQTRESVFQQAGGQAGKLLSRRLLQMARLNPFGLHTNTEDNNKKRNPSW